MTSAELRKACAKATGDRLEDVIIELDRPARERSNMRLLPGRGPKGQVLGVGRTNRHTLALFQVDMVLMWLDGKGSKVWGKADEENIGEVNQ